MSHSVHHTEGFVLDSNAVGESHRSLLIFTRELGLVRAIVQSARTERSKLRNHTQNYTAATFNLVRGRELWRVTGALSHCIFSPANGTSLDRMHVIARVASLLKRLLQEEERDKYLYEIVSVLLRMLRYEKISEEHISQAEYVTVLRMLYSLGYVAQTDELEKLLSGVSLTTETLGHAMAFRRNIIRTINQSLAASHL